MDGVNLNAVGSNVLQYIEDTGQEIEGAAQPEIVDATTNALTKALTPAVNQTAPTGKIPDQTPVLPKSNTGLQDANAGFFKNQTVKYIVIGVLVVAGIYIAFQLVKKAV